MTKSARSRARFICRAISVLFIRLTFGNSAAEPELVPYVKFTSAIRTPFTVSNRGLFLEYCSSSRPEPVNTPYCFKVRSSPFGPLSRMWLFAVSRTSTPASRMLERYVSGALNAGYPV